MKKNIFSYTAPTSRGFTLVELLVVVSIIGILSAIVTTSLGSAKKKSRDSKRVADIKSIQLALSVYYNDNAMYPKNIYAAAGTAPDGGLAPTYLPMVPRDPNATGSEACSGTGANGLAGCYKYNAYTTAVSQLCSSTNIPVLYHIGAAFEESTNAALTQDMDGSSNLSNIYTSPAYYYCSNSPSPTSAFDGTSASCNSSSAATESNCYDLTP